jgi:hypothetical protein
MSGGNAFESIIVGLAHFIQYIVTAVSKAETVLQKERAAAVGGGIVNGTLAAGAAATATSSTAIEGGAVVLSGVGFLLGGWFLMSGLRRIVGGLVYVAIAVLIFAGGLSSWVIYNYSPYYVTPLSNSTAANLTVT